MCLCVFQTADQQYQDAFNDELESFKERVRGRAKIRIDKAMKEYEEEERQKRLGPGGLDPVEVYEGLPAVRLTPHLSLPIHTVTIVMLTCSLQENTQHHMEYVLNIYSEMWLM